MVSAYREVSNYKSIDVNADILFSYFEYMLTKNNIKVRRVPISYLLFIRKQKFYMWVFLFGICIRFCYKVFEEITILRLYRSEVQLDNIIEQKNYLHF